MPFRYSLMFGGKARRLP